MVLRHGALHMTMSTCICTGGWCQRGHVSPSAPQPSAAGGAHSALTLVHLAPIATAVQRLRTLHRLCQDTNVSGVTAVPFGPGGTAVSSSARMLADSVINAGSGAARGLWMQFAERFHGWRRRKTALKEAFTALMTADAAAVAAAVQRLTARLQRQKDEGGTPLTAKESLALRLHEQYPEVSSFIDIKSQSGQVTQQTISADASDGICCQASMQTQGAPIHQVANSTGFWVHQA